ARGTKCRERRRPPRTGRSRPWPPGPPDATRGGRASLVAPLGEMNVLEVEGLLRELRGRADAAELPGRHVGEARVITLRFAVRRLVLLPEMPAARLLAVERVFAHELGELEEVRHAPRFLERLVQIFTGPRDEHVLPEPLPH